MLVMLSKLIEYYILYHYNILLNNDFNGYLIKLFILISTELKCSLILKSNYSRKQISH